MAECCAAGTRSGKRRKTSHSVKYRRAGLFGMWVVCLCVCVPCRAVPAACVSQRNNNRRYDHSSGYWWLSRVASHRKSLGPRPDLFFFFFFFHPTPPSPPFFHIFFCYHPLCLLRVPCVGELLVLRTDTQQTSTSMQSGPASSTCSTRRNRKSGRQWPMTKAETTADSDEKIPIKTKGEKIKSPRGLGQLDRIQLARSEKERKMAAFGIVDGWPLLFSLLWATWQRKAEWKRHVYELDDFLGRANRKINDTRFLISFCPFALVEGGGERFSRAPKRT